MPDTDRKSFHCCSNLEYVTGSLSTLESCYSVIGPTVEFSGFVKACLSCWSNFVFLVLQCWNHTQVLCIQSTALSLGCTPVQGGVSLERTLLRCKVSSQLFLNAFQGLESELQSDECSFCS
jgi:hypothetical protein